MSDADLLRRAAALMRERAEAAGSEWNADVEPGDSLHLWVTDCDPSDPTGETAMQRLVGGADAPWSEHIASWHPAVALAVADWLDVAARDLWAHGTDCYEADHEPCWECDDDLAAPHVRAAVTVARAYLGGDDE